MPEVERLNRPKSGLEPRRRLVPDVLGGQRPGNSGDWSGEGRAAVDVRR